MRRFLGIVIGLAAWVGLTSSGALAQQGTATQTLCADGSDTLCSVMPTDMANVKPLVGYIPDTNAGTTGAFNQTFVDYFGWQSFVALNWPLDASGKPSATESIVSNETAPRVWSLFKSKDDVFGTANAAAGECAAAPGKLRLGNISKFSPNEFLEAFTPYPLIDRDLNFVVYDIRLNDTEVAYLQNNGLTTKAGQEAFGKAYDFPAGVNDTVGAIEIKTAWRILTDPDDFDEFYTTEAQIMIPAKNSETGNARCIDAIVGLVGMHIMQKFSHPEEFRNFWAWASFEHVDNAPTANKAPISQLNGESTLETLDPPSCTLAPNPLDNNKYSFYNRFCNEKGKICPVNAPPSLKGDTNFKWAKTAPYAAKYATDGLTGAYGTQVARCFDIYPSADQVTADYVNQFGQSVWKNYMLVGVQWAASGSTGAPPLSLLNPYPAPIYMANTTMETYVQIDPVKKPEGAKSWAPGSCVICHNLAKDSAGNDSNLSFLPGFAK